MAEFIEIVDSIMGSSKTNRLLEWIDNNPDEKYLYVSPLLSEIDKDSRLQNNLKYVTFENPENVDSETKSDDLLSKLKENANICCTHKLYLTMTEEHLSEIKDRGYICLIDEEVGVIDSFNAYSSDDLLYMLKNKDIDISSEDGMISWIGEDVGTKNKYKHFESLCNSKAVYATKRKDTMMVTQLPIELITCAKRVIILTYLFEGNVLDCFLRLKGIKTVPFTEITPDVIAKDTIRNLLTLIPPTKPVKDVKMTVSGYNNCTQKDCNVVSSFIRNVSRKYAESSYDVMYTFPKALSETDRKNGRRIRPASFIEYKLPKLDEDRVQLKNSKGELEYTRNPCWVYASCRATNAYAFKSVLIHCYDRYPNAAVEQYLADYGFPIKRKVFALSEICQWVWRSQIRKSLPIVLAIGSQRMHDIFEEWLNKD